MESCSSVTSGPSDQDLEINVDEISSRIIAKLKNEEHLGEEDLISKLFNLMLEYTADPSRKHLNRCIRELLTEFPVLKNPNYKIAKRNLVRLLQQKFSAFKAEVFRKELTRKADKCIQTDPQPVIQDLSPLLFALKQECVKKDPDHEKIQFYMRLTYQYRRGFIINTVPKVMAVLEIYPALFNSGEVRREFLRITGKETDAIFHENVRKYCPVLYSISRDSDVKIKIDDCISEARKMNRPFDMRNSGMLLLPFLLKENHNFLWFNNEGYNTHQTEPFIKCNATVEEVICCSDDGGCFQVVAENVLLAETSSFIVAIECFLASFFIFLIEYRSGTKKTLQILQTLFYEHDDPLEDVHPRVIRLAERLKNRVNPDKSE